MFTLKVISRDSIQRSLERAERYRVLNEPAEAESICLDVLHIDPDNQQALVTLLLAITDQFETGVSPVGARNLLPRLASEYERLYYDGLISERRAKARLKRDGPGAGFVAYEWFMEAMTRYEAAEALKPPGNDDATLRWNTCARIVMSNPRIQPAHEERTNWTLE
jgi:hypothetical protein